MKPFVSKQILFFALLLSSLTTFAQFGGGKGDGHIMSKGYPSSLTGSARLDVPQNLVAFSGALENYLLWSPVKDAISYEIHAATNITGPYSVIATTGDFDTLYTHKNLNSFTNYYYQIKAIFPYNLKSAFSNTATATTLSNIFAGGKGNGFSYVGNLCFTNLDGTPDSTSVQFIQLTSWLNTNYLNWQPREGANKYLVYVSPSNTIDTNTTFLTTTFDTSFVQSNVIQNTDYYYSIRVIDSCGDTSSHSTLFKITGAGSVYVGGFADGHGAAPSCFTRLDGSIIKTAPSNLNVVSGGALLAASWDDAFETDSYIVVLQDSNRDNIDSAFTSNTSAKFENLVPYSKYYIQVIGVPYCGVLTDTSVGVVGIPAPNYFVGGKGDGHSLDFYPCFTTLGGQFDSTAPRNLSVKNGINSTVVSFNKILGTKNYILSYDTSASTLAGAGNILDVDTVSVNYVHSGLLSNQRYYYSVAAIDSCGDTTRFSSIISGESIGNYFAGGGGDGHDLGRTCPIKLDGTVDTTAPVFTSVTEGPNSVILQWELNPEIDSFIIRVKRGVNGTPFEVRNLTTNQLIIDTLTGLQNYYFNLSAKYVCGEFTDTSAPVLASPASNYFVGGKGDGDNTEISPCYTDLNGAGDSSAITNLQITTAPLQANLTWNVRPGGANYEILRNTDSTQLASNVGTLITGITTNSKIDTVPQGFLRYYYKVRVTDSCGLTSAYSTIVGVNIQGNIYAGGGNDGHAARPSCFGNLNGLIIPQAGPTNLVATGAAGGVDLTWRSVKDVESYQVEVKNLSTNAIFTFRDIKDTFTQITDSVTSSFSYEFKVFGFLSCQNLTLSSNTDTASPIVDGYVFRGGKGDGHANQFASCETFLDGGKDSIAPNGLTAGGFIESINLSWNTKSNANYYRLYWDTTSTTIASGGGNIIDSIYGTAYTHLNRTAFQTVYYSLQAVDSCGDSTARTSVQSGAAISNFYVGGEGDGHNFGTTCFTKIDGNIVTTPPSGLSGIPGAATAYLNWNTVLDADSYRIVFKRGINGTVQSAGLSNANAFVAENLVALDSYYFAVSAKYLCGEFTDTSSFVLVRPASNYYVGGKGDGHSKDEEFCFVLLNGQPDTTSIKSFTVNGWVEQNEISWSSKLGIKEYVLYWDTNATNVANYSGNRIVITNTGGNVSSFTHNSRTPYQPYYYTILAKDSCGDSTMLSSVKSGTPIPNFYTGGEGDGHDLGTTCFVRVAGTLITTPPSGLYGIPSAAAAYLFYNSILDADSYNIVFKRGINGIVQSAGKTKDLAYIAENLIALDSYYFAVSAQYKCGSYTDTSSFVLVRPAPNYFVGGKGDGHSTDGKDCFSLLNGQPDTVSVKNFVTNGWVEQNEISWSPKLGVKEYVLYWDTNATNPANYGNNRLVITNTGGNISNFVHNNRTAYQTYYYTILAKDSCGDSTLLSSVKSATPIPNFYTGGEGDGHDLGTTCYIRVAGTIITTPPSGLTAIAGAASAYLNWNSILDADSYNIVYKRGANGVVQSAGKTNELAFVAENLVALDSYFFAVSAQYKCGSYTDTSSFLLVRPAPNYFVGGKGDGHTSAGEPCFALLNGRPDTTAVQSFTAYGWVQEAQLNWNQKLGTKEYVIYWDTIQNNPSSYQSNRIVINSGNTINYTQTNLTPYKTYYYTILAKDSCGDSSILSVERSATIIPNFYAGGEGDGHNFDATCYVELDGDIVKTPPTYVSVVPSDMRVYLRWNSILDADSYNVIFKIGSAGSPRSAIITNDTLFEHQNLQPLDSYFYAISATYKCGGQTDTSNYIVAIPTGNTFAGGKGDGHSSDGEPCYQYLDGDKDTSAVRNFAGVGFINSSNLSWSKRFSTKDYQILWNTDSSALANDTGTLITNVSDTTYIHSGLTPYIRHFYKIRSVDTCGTISLYSGIISTNPIGNFYAGGSGDGHSVFPSCPINLNGSVVKTPPSSLVAYSGPQSVTLFWNSVFEADSYIVTMKRGVSGTPIQIRNLTNNNLTIDTLTALQNYYFNVQAKYLCGEFTDTSAPVLGLPSPNYCVGGKGDGHSSNGEPCYQFLDGDKDTTIVRNFAAIGFITSSNLSWSKRFSTKEYQILWNTDSSALANDTGNLITNITDSTYTHSSLTPYIKHYYKIRGVDTCGTFSIYSSILSTSPIGNFYAGGPGDGHDIDLSCPVLLDGTVDRTPPVNITVTEGSQLVVLQWSSVVDVDSYIVRIKRGVSGVPYEVRNLTTTQLVIDTLTGLQDYYFNVSAKYLCGEFTDTSAPIKATPAVNYFAGGKGDGHISSITPCTSFLDGDRDSSAPLNFSVRAGIEFNSLSWRFRPGAEQYQILWNLDSTQLAAANGTLIQGITDTVYTHSSLAPYNRYFYRIRVLDSCSEYSLYTGIISAEPIANFYTGGEGDGHNMGLTCPITLDGTVDRTPPTFTSVTEGPNTVILEWSNVTDVDSFIIRMKRGINGIPIEFRNLTGNQLILDTLQGLQNYYFNVQAKYLCGEFTDTSAPVVGSPASNYFVGGKGDGHSTFASDCYTDLDGNSDSSAIQILSVSGNILSANFTFQTKIGGANYQLLRNTDSTQLASNVGTVISGITSTTHIDTVPTGFLRYFYKLRVTDSCGITTAYSNIVGIDILGNIYAGGFNDGHASKPSCFGDLDGNTLPVSGPLNIFTTNKTDHVATTWFSIPNVEYYEIKVKRTGSSTDSIYIGTKDTTFEVYGLEPTVNYEFRVRGRLTCGDTTSSSPFANGQTLVGNFVFQGGKGDGHADQFASCITYLDGKKDSIAPTGLTAGGFINSINLTWNAAANANRYNIYWDTIPGTVNAGGGNLLNAPTNTFIHDNLTPYVTYYYTVQTVDSCGDTTARSSVASDAAIANFYTGGEGDGHNFGLTCPIKLDGNVNTTPPANLTAIEGANLVVLEWSSVIDVDSYIVRIKRGTTGIPYEVRNLTSTRLVIDTLTGMQDYYFNIQAKYLCGEFTDTSAPIKATPAVNYFVGGNGDGHTNGINCLTYLDGNNDSFAVRNLNALAYINNATLTWNTKPFVASYQILWSTDSNQVNSNLGSTITVNSPDTQFVHSGLTAYQNYYYKVRFVDSCGNMGNYSNRVDAYPIGNYFTGGEGDGHELGTTCYVTINGTVIKTAPVGLRAIAADNKAILQWNSVLDADSYIIAYRLAPSNSWTYVRNIEDTQYIQTGLTAYGSYYFNVTAIYKCSEATDSSASVLVVPAGNYFAGGKGDGSILTDGCYGSLNGNPIITAPDSFVASAYINNSTLTWARKPFTETYQILWNTDSAQLASNNGTTINVTGLNTTYLHDTLTAYQFYYYKIRTVDTCGVIGNYSGIIKTYPLGNYFSGGEGDGHVVDATCFTELDGDIIRTAPANVSAIAGVNSVIVSWSPVLDYDSFVVNYKKGVNGNWNQIRNITSLSYSVDSLTPYDTFFFTVAAKYKCGSLTDTSNSVFAIPIANFFAGGKGDGHTQETGCYGNLDGTADSISARNFVATAFIQSANLSWNKKNFVKYYEILWSNNITDITNGNANVIDSLTDTTFIHTSLTPYINYFYAVRTVDSCGNTSIISAIRTVEPIANFFTGGEGDGHNIDATCYTKLDGNVVRTAPASISGVAMAGSAFLNWSGVIDADSFILYRKQGVTGSYVEVVRTVDTNYIDLGLTGLATYFYNVRAIYKCGAQTDTSFATSLTPAPNYFIGGKGGGDRRAETECLVLMNGSKDTTIVDNFTAKAWIGTVDVKWSKRINNQYYKLYWSTTQGQVTQGLGNVIQTTDTFRNFTGLTAYQSYYYAIQAFDSCGDSSIITPELEAIPISNFYTGGGQDGHAMFSTCFVELDGTIKTPPPSNFKGFAGVNENYLQWDSVAEATSYILYWGTTPNPARFGTAITGLTTESFTHSNLTIGTTYYYQLRAVYECGTPDAVTNDLVLVPISNYFVGGKGDGFSSDLAPDSFLSPRDPMKGIYTVNRNKIITDRNFHTITEAIDELNFRGVDSQVVFVLQNNSYSTAETFPITVNRIQGANSAKTVTIQSDTNLNVSIEGNASSIFKLRGTRYFSINGNTLGDTLRQLTLRNLDTSRLSNVLWVGSDSSNNAEFNTFKNLIIEGRTSSTTFAGIYIGDYYGTGFNTRPYFSPNYNRIENNFVYNSQYGIFVKGRSNDSLAKGNMLINNQLGSRVNSDGSKVSAIYADNQDSMLISNNDIRNVFSDAGNVAGIEFNNVTRSNVFANNIGNINFTGSSLYRAFGIMLNAPDFNSSISPASNLIANNMIHSITSSAKGLTWNVGGIVHRTGYGDKVYHNSVSLDNKLAGDSLGTAFAYGNGILPSVSAANADVRNNVFRVISRSTIKPNVYALYLPNLSSLSGYIFDNNNLFTQSYGHSRAFIATRSNTNYSSLQSWVAASNVDSNSIAAEPYFVSETDLHPTNQSCVLRRKGTPLTLVTVDFDSLARSTTNPDLGAANVGNLQGVWVGFTSNWNVSSNWCNDTIPNCTNGNPAIIPASAINMPVITNGQTVGASSLEILQGASIEIQNGAIYESCPNGSVINRGSIIIRSGGIFRRR
jgi:hypothetical protein